MPARAHPAADRRIPRRALLLALLPLAACGSDRFDCRDLGLVEGDRDNCVCPEPYEPTEDRMSCRCPSGLVVSGDTCVAPDAGPGGGTGPAATEDLVVYSTIDAADVERLVVRRRACSL